MRRKVECGVCGKEILLYEALDHTAVRYEGKCPKCGSENVLLARRKKEG